MIETKGCQIGVIAFVLIFFIGFGAAKTIINVHGHWGTFDEIKGHDEGIWGAY